MFFLSLAAAFVYYHKYYVHMKATHTSKWSELMNRDPAIAFLGEWIRWPFGSTYLLATFFKADDFGDVKLRTYRQRALVAIGLLLCSFCFLLALASNALP
jgi:hypothetical protein